MNAGDLLQLSSAHFLLLVCQDRDKGPKKLEAEL